MRAHHCCRAALWLLRGPRRPSAAAERGAALASRGEQSQALGPFAAAAGESPASSQPLGERAPEDSSRGLGKWGGGLLLGGLPSCEDKGSNMASKESA